jgi:hypothetical protein
LAGWRAATPASSPEDVECSDDGASLKADRRLIGPVQIVEDHNKACLADVGIPGGAGVTAAVGGVAVAISTGAESPAG